MPAFYLREAEDRGDRYLATNLRFTNTYWLLQDDPDRAASEAEAGRIAWSKQGFHLQHFLGIVARGQVALYRGEGEAGHARLVAESPRVARSLTLRMQVAQEYYSVNLRARSALGAAEASPERRALLREADRGAAMIEAERMAWADPLAALVRAGAARLRGDDVRAGPGSTRRSAASTPPDSPSRKRRRSAAAVASSGATRAAPRRRWPNNGCAIRVSSAPIASPR